MCWHRWTKWKDVGQSSNGGVIIQEKRCEKCNKARRRKTDYIGFE